MALSRSDRDLADMLHLALLLRYPWPDHTESNLEAFPLSPRYGSHASDAAAAIAKLFRESESVTLHDADGEEWPVARGTLLSYTVWHEW